MPELDAIMQFIRRIFVADVSAGNDQGKTRESERGDVPGWVLITLMTAALVAAIWTVAQDALLQLFEQAMSRFAGR